MASDLYQLIDTILDAIDYAEMDKDPQGLIKARQLLNNDLREAIAAYILRKINSGEQELDMG